ncbi:SPOR domain-containing protein [Sphingorhabdus sp. Alg239-R122]|uniref:SPOR domain-containing protein n=1 Tax=Sphingorhabdus sp. Alg239-R122 TaxID=2305989 RepID=UPI001968952C|nr:SPOR domain-containing protein [Sphingorhabdus sp. Alg239-R122]
MPLTLPATAYGFMQDDVPTLTSRDDEAITEWRALAEKGDADAQYNLGQAYTIGQDVDRDLAVAEQWLAKAAKQGHARAIESYGLILFRNNRQAEAMPYIQAAAARGEPRAQYILGIAHFNGDLAKQDWVLAYAYMLLAAEAGLPQADLNLATMDRHVPIEERQEGIRLARKIERDAKSINGEQIIAVISPETPSPSANQEAATENDVRQSDVANAGDAMPEMPADTEMAGTDQQIAQASPQEVVQPLPDEPADTGITTTELPPSQVADMDISQVDIVPADEPAQTQAIDTEEQELVQAQADDKHIDASQDDILTQDIATAEREPEATVNDSDAGTPAEEQQDVTLSDADASVPVIPDTDSVETDNEELQPVTVTEESKPASLAEENMADADEITPPADTEEPVPTVTTSQEVQQDNWRIQLGAFRTSEKVESAWQGLQARHETLAGLELYVQDAGEFKRLQVGPFTNRADAALLCRNLKNQACFVVKSD